MPTTYPRGGRALHDQLRDASHDLRESLRAARRRQQHMTEVLSRNPVAAREALLELRVLLAESEALAADIDRLLMAFDRLMMD